jgi:hypothetical protein
MRYLKTRNRISRLLGVELVLTIVNELHTQLRKVMELKTVFFPCLMTAF